MLAMVLTLSKLGSQSNRLDLMCARSLSTSSEAAMVMSHSQTSSSHERTLSWKCGTSSAGALAPNSLVMAV